MSIFDTIAAAKPRGGPRNPFTPGGYLCEVQFLGIKTSQKSNDEFVLLEATVIESMGDDAKAPGEPVARAFQVSAAGWAGAYAASDLRALIAACVGCEFAEVDAATCKAACGAAEEGGAPGTAMRGARFRVVCTQNSKGKVDPNTGAPYIDFAFGAP